MKKHTVAVLLGLLLVFCMTSLLFSRHSLSFHSGIYLQGDHGGHIIIIENSPVVLRNSAGKLDLFTGLTSGDKIFILHDGIQESYPGQTGVYALLKISSGPITAVPKDILISLRELGWWRGSPSASP